MSVPPSTTAPTLPTTGDVIDDKYVLERLLGKGGMGAVYAARHRKLGHAVAIKVMLADAANHEAASRFVNEGRAAANIQNEHVVRVSDVDEENGYAYMVLELLEGEDLAQVLERERRLAPHVAVDYVLQTLAGVRQAHIQGIVHRDLKPSNLFLAKRQDGSSIIKVLDFGISKAGASNPLGTAPGALTSTKAMLGSPLYMSPEQLRSSKNVDARADIWAIGVILHELCTGTLPFMGENLGELFAQILEVEAPPLRAQAPEAPAALEAIVSKCLQRKPENRFQNVGELERELVLLRAAGPQGGFVAGPPVAGAHTAMMTTPQHGYVQTPPPYDPRVSPPQQFHMTPQGGQLPPQSGAYPPMRNVQGATTGSGGHPPVVKGTVALGGVTPQPNALGEAAWQNTGSGGAGLPSKTSTTGLIVAGFALVALIGVALGTQSYIKSRKHEASGGIPDPSVSAAAVPPPSATPLPTAATASTTPTNTAAAPSATTSSAASAAASVVVAPRQKPPGPGIVAKPETKAVEPPADPPPPPAKKPPTAKPEVEQVTR